jgi:hypothetical protein
LDSDGIHQKAVEKALSEAEDAAEGQHRRLMEITLNVPTTIAWRSMTAPDVVQ